MIVLIGLVVVVLSFTRVPMWLLVTLLALPPAAISVFTRDASAIKVTVLALLGALVFYLPLAFLISLVMAGGVGVAFRRFRVVYFVFALVLFVVLVFNMTQLIGVV